MNKDIHPKLGPRLRKPNMKIYLEVVRQTYPLAGMERSTEDDRSFPSTI